MASINSAPSAIQRGGGQKSLWTAILNCLSLSFGCLVNRERVVEQLDYDTIIDEFASAGSADKNKAPWVRNLSDAD